MCTLCKCIISLIFAYCYAELAVSSLAVAVTVANTHYTTTHGGMARLSWPGWFGLISRRCTRERSHIIIFVLVLVHENNALTFIIIIIIIIRSYTKCNEKIKIKK